MIAITCYDGADYMENIGYKLAFLQNSTNSNSFSIPDESENNIEQFNQENSKNNLPTLSHVIPDQICSINDSFLNNNFDFFNNYIYGPPEYKNCLKLFTHLNSCYSCFSIFSQTMRDFFHKKNEIAVNAKGVAK